MCIFIVLFFFFKQKTAYEMRISDWSSDVCSSDLCLHRSAACAGGGISAHDLDGAVRDRRHRHLWLARSRVGTAAARLKRARPARLCVRQRPGPDSDHVAAELFGPGDDLRPLPAPIYTVARRPADQLFIGLSG